MKPRQIKKKSPYSPKDKKFYPSALFLIPANTQGHGMTYYIFITGGVVSSLGKGIATSAIAALLQLHNLKIRIRKLDPYLNIDPGTMNPMQHGEVYVTEDGAETDLDLGHYERFTGVQSEKTDNVTAGKIYSTILSKERKGDYLGNTVQTIPHVTDEIKKFITYHKDEDIILCEIGGTVGDIESLPFLESIRQLRCDLGRHKTFFIHLTLLPYMDTTQELKTKPTQHSVKELLSIGIQPDLLICRSKIPIPFAEKQKIASFCNVELSHVIESKDLATVYQLPLEFKKQKIDEHILQYFQLKPPVPPNLDKWHTLVRKTLDPKRILQVGIIGKYTQLPDSYKSLIEALSHGGLSHDTAIDLKLIDSAELETDSYPTILKNLHGIIVPGGFGSRGISGKINAIHYARTHHVPFLGICLGMQLAVLEIAKNVLHLPDASSVEFNKNAINPIVGYMSSWMKEDQNIQRSLNDNLGGTMRLGSYPCIIAKHSLAHRIYQKEKIFERHRHRYEINYTYQDLFQSTHLLFSGFSPDGLLPEIIELPYHVHPWFIAVQFHPELKSNPFAPHPLFVSFVEAGLSFQKNNPSHA